MSTSLTYRFGPYELRSRTRELYKQGTKLKLRPQPFQVLHLLAERKGDLVTREELKEQLWSKETFVDFEHGLNTAIKEIRSVLNDSATEPRYIQTLPKLGYRLVAPVAKEELIIGEPASLSSAAPAEPNEVERQAKANHVGNVAKSRLWWLLPVGAMVLGFGAVVWYHKATTPRPQAQAGGTRLMLAVLPFENLTGDAGQEYFSDGLTEEMIAQLGRLDPQHLAVIGRSSVMRYKQNRGQPQEIGHDLGVQYLLEGSVRRDAGRIRISAELIQTKDQANVWSHQYDRQLGDILTVQADIAQAIAGEIRITLNAPNANGTLHPAQLSSQSYEAYDLYLRGLYFWNKRSPEGFKKAIGYFEDAVKKDPTSARAYAALANSYVLMSGYRGFVSRELMTKARDAARRAVELDETLAEAHTSMALVAQDCDWDWTTAEKEYRRAIELDPSYATAHHWYAEFLALMGRFEEAQAEIGTARRLDPQSLIIVSDNGVILYYSRKYELSMQEYRTVLEMDPNFPRAVGLMNIYVEKGMRTELLTTLGKLEQENVDSAWHWEQLAYFNARAGRVEEARRALRRIEELDKAQPVDPLVFAMVHIGLNEKEQALENLEKAYAQHSMSLTGAKVDPVYDSLRNEPRFKNLLQRMHLT
jgi:TolB-like protein/DNA-binding winged helix-turn-helix (wHTH) protein/Tfp pilus assembly protein PilF